MFLRHFLSEVLTATNPDSFETKCGLLLIFQSICTMHASSFFSQCSRAHHELHAGAAQGGFAFAFVEGALASALRDGSWLLLDEVRHTCASAGIPCVECMHVEAAAVFELRSMLRQTRLFSK